jgi:hypothetical protein
MQRTTTVSLGLFAAWACHDLEELFTMRETSRVVAAWYGDGRRFSLTSTSG